MYIHGSLIISWPCRNGSCRDLALNRPLPVWPRRRLQAAQKVVSKLSKKMRPCYTFSKFGDCKKPQCPFLHPGGVLRDGVWRKEAAAPEKPQASAAKEEPAGTTAGDTTTAR